MTRFRLRSTGRPVPPRRLRRPRRLERSHRRPPRRRPRSVSAAVHGRPRRGPLPARGHRSWCRPDRPRRAFGEPTRLGPPRGRSLRCMTTVLPELACLEVRLVGKTETGGDAGCRFDRAPVSAGERASWQTRASERAGSGPAQADAGGAEIMSRARATPRLRTGPHRVGNPVGAHVVAAGPTRTGFGSSRLHTSLIARR